MSRILVEVKCPKCHTTWYSHFWNTSELKFEVINMSTLYRRCIYCETVINNLVLQEVTYDAETQETNVKEVGDA